MTDKEIILQCLHYISYYYEYGIDDKSISEFGNKYLSTYPEIKRLKNLIEDKLNEETNI